MKIDALDAHDRFEHFTKKRFDISECCQDLINKRPFGNYPFYIFAHARTEDNGIDTRIIWQPRLSRPFAQTNSMLFKGYPGKEDIKICWIIPKRELFDQYKKGNVTENELVRDCIRLFETDREALNKPEDDDLTDQQIAGIYVEISMDANRNKAMERLYKNSKLRL